MTIIEPSRLLAERPIDGDLPCQTGEGGQRARSRSTWPKARSAGCSRAAMSAGANIDAGERLRTDWERGQLAPRVTMTWDAAPVCAQPRRIGASASTSAVRSSTRGGGSRRRWPRPGRALPTYCGGWSAPAKGCARRKPRSAGRRGPARWCFGIALDRVADYYRIALGWSTGQSKSRPGDAAMILYGSTMSPFVRKVAAYAAEKGIEIELKPTGFADPDPEFRAASPFKKMPALVDGDYRLADSSAIIHYLEAKYPEPELIPADPRERGPDDLVRRVRRHDAVRLRREDVLQQGRRAALPRPRGRSCGGRNGRARRAAAAARLSGRSDSRTAAIWSVTG